MIFRDNDIGVLRFFHYRNFQPSGKLSFFSHQKACQTYNFSLRAIQICQKQPKGKQHIQEKCHGAANYRKVAMKYLQVSVYVACTVVRTYCSQQCQFQELMHMPRRVLWFVFDLQIKKWNQLHTHSRIIIIITC